jgi:hypothetical protein
VPRRVLAGAILIALAAAVGPVICGIAALQQILIAQAVAAIENDPSCSAPMTQRLDGPCLTRPARAVRKYTETSDGVTTAYHVVVALGRGKQQDVTFWQAPVLYDRIHRGRAMTVRLYQEKPVAIAIGGLAAASYAPLREQSASWEQARDFGLNLTLFELLLAVVYASAVYLRGPMPAR